MDNVLINIVEHPEQVTVSVTEQNDNVTVIVSEMGTQGQKGDSAYQVALNNGFVGTQQDWLDSLKGDKGDKGDTGDTGNDGFSAYQVALNNGFVGTEQYWLDSLVGDKGDKGDKGDTGLQGDKGDKGDTGDTGPQGSMNVFNSTSEFTFSSEEDYTELIISNSVLTNANFKAFTYIPIETTATSIDDWKLNAVSLQVTEIIDNTSIKVSAFSYNGATGIYTAKLNFNY